MTRLAFPTRIKASHSPSFLFTFFFFPPSHYFSCVSFLLSLPFNFSVLFQYNISLLLFLLLYSTIAHMLLSLAFIYFPFLFLLILCVRVCLDFLPISLVFFISFFSSLFPYSQQYLLFFVCLSSFSLSLSKTVSFSLWESLLRRKHFMCTLPFLGCMTWNMGKRNSKLKPDEIEELRTKTYCKYLLVKKTILFFFHLYALSL